MIYRTMLRFGAFGLAVLLGTGLAAGTALAEEGVAAEGAVYKGVVFGDANGDKKLDAGEELDGATVTIKNDAFREEFKKTTGPKGAFEFTGLQPHAYEVRVFLDGWSFPPFANVVPTETGEPAASLGGTRPLRDTLAASMKFQQEAYNLGDTVHLRVELKNSGTLAAENIKAACDDEDGSLDGTADGWGDLRFTAPGVRIGPGETKTIDVTDVVPAEAAEQGYVSVFCAFEPDGTVDPPFAFDTANIRGKTGIGHGRLLQDKNGDRLFDDPVSNVKVVVIDPARHVLVAKAMTDTQGNFDTPVLPAKLYEIVVVGPWQPDFSLMVLPVNSDGDPGDRFAINLKPGPEQADPFPDQPAQPTLTTPASQGANAPAALAATGSNVDGLIVLSLGLVVAGVGAVLASRRRRVNRS